MIEAAERSGSLITAKLAAEFGRPVFAVPGSPLDPACHGTNGLLKQGAITTTGSADVIDTLAPLSQLGLLTASMVEEPGRAGGSLLLPDDDVRAGIVSAMVLSRSRWTISSGIPACPPPAFI